MTLNNFNYAATLAEMQYGVNLQPEDFQELALIAWNKIGNHRYKLYKVTLESDCDNKVELPCNCDEIEAITYGFEDWQHVSNIYPEGDLFSQFTEGYIEGRKQFLDPFYVSGRYMKYERVGNTLYLDKDYGKIYLLYKGEQVDDEGLPEITDAEADALATYVAYITKYKQGLITNNTNLLNISKDLEAKWYRKCDQCRVPDSVSQNEMNEILDAKTSWNRKSYNKSYKPLK